MPEIRVLSADDVRRLLDPAALRRALEAALVAQANGQADVPPRIMAAAPAGLLAAMPGHLALADGGLMATKLVTIYPGNVAAPSHQGVIVFFDAGTGTPLALLDAEVITEDRTAGTAAIAADLLARADADTLAIVGTGAQARAHVRALASLRPWRRLTIVGRSSPGADALAEYAATVLPSVAVDTGSDIDGAVAGSDLVALCTHADAAVIDAAAIDAGTHVSSVGSGAELPPDLASHVLVVDHPGAVTSPPPAGAAEVQGAAHAVEIGALIADPTLGRTSPTQITVYKSTGHAVQDIAASQLVYAAAVERDLGVIVTL